MAGYKPAARAGGWAAACCCENAVGAYLRSPADDETDGSDGHLMPDMTDMDVFLKRVRSHGFTVTAMAFQDAQNLDLERLKRCSLHVYDSGSLVPFCKYYM